MDVVKREYTTQIALWKISFFTFQCGTRQLHQNGGHVLVTARKGSFCHLNKYVGFAEAGPRNTAEFFPTFEILIFSELFSRRSPFLLEIFWSFYFIILGDPCGGLPSALESTRMIVSIACFPWASRQPSSETFRGAEHTFHACLTTHIQLSDDDGKIPQWEVWDVCSFFRSDLTNVRSQCCETLFVHKSKENKL